MTVDAEDGQHDALVVDGREGGHERCCLRSGHSQRNAGVGACGMHEKGERGIQPGGYMGPSRDHLEWEGGGGRGKNDTFEAV